jgi:transposase
LTRSQLSQDRPLLACAVRRRRFPVSASPVLHSTSVAVSRELRRAKTDRLDAAMLMRVFLGWLRSEHGHRGMVAIPTLEDEDARDPSRERESLVDERTRIINRMKAILAWLGVRGSIPNCARRRSASTSRGHRRICLYAQHG